MIGDERALILEEELLIVRHSGEIPEIALHATLHYLCNDPNGPKFLLSAEELISLEDAALARYREIILRDLDPDNRDLPLYRGMQRVICNWQRFKMFCTRIKRDWSGFRPEVGQALYRFLCQEEKDVSAGRRRPSINCTVQELKDFAAEMKLSSSQMPRDPAALCQQQENPT